MFRRPDGTQIQSSEERNGAQICSRTGEQTSQQASQQVMLTHKQPWSACGDDMDYAMALYNLASANREQHHSHAQD